MQSTFPFRGRSAGVRGPGAPLARLSVATLAAGCLAAGILGQGSAFAAPSPTAPSTSSTPTSATTSDASNSASAPASGSDSATPGMSTTLAATANPAATAAGDWLASQLKGGQYLVNPYAKVANTPDVPGTADAVVGLVASGTARSTASTADAWLQKQAHTLTKLGQVSPGQVSKVLLAAEAMGDDVHHYGGVDLPAVLQKQLAAPHADLTSPYGDALAIIALHRAGVTAPAPLVTALVNQQQKKKQQQADGEFFFTGTKGQPNTPDPDSTGVAISALADVSGNAAATTAEQNAVKWANTNRVAQGYWASYSPVNTTGIIASALNDTGADVNSSLAWMKAQQKLAGGKGLPATLNGTAPDTYATAQGLLLLGGVSLETVKYASTTPTPSASMSASGTPTPSAPASSTAPNPLPATGDGDASSDNGLLVGAGVIGAAAVAALFMGRRRR